MFCVNTYIVYACVYVVIYNLHYFDNLHVFIIIFSHKLNFYLHFLNISYITYIF